MPDGTAYRGLPVGHFCRLARHSPAWRGKTPAWRGTAPAWRGKTPAGAGMARPAGAA